MKRLCIGCFGLLIITMIMVGIVLWLFPPEGRPLAPDEVKGYDYSATTASGAVLTTTSTLSFGNSTTSAQKTVSLATVLNKVKLPPQKAGIWQSFLDYLTGRKHVSIITVDQEIALKIILLFNLIFDFGFLVWLGFYTTDPFNERIRPFCNFLGGTVIGISTIWYHWLVTILVVLAVFYGLSRLYRMNGKQMLLACFIAVAVLCVIVGTIYSFWYVIFRMGFEKAYDPDSWNGY